MKSFKKHFNEAKDTHCSDKCCGADTKAEDCDCPADCPHCNCNSVNEKVGSEYIPHWMVHPKTGERIRAEKEVDHHRMKAMGYTAESVEPDLDEALDKWAGTDKRKSYYTSVKHAYRPKHRNTGNDSYDPKKVETQAHLQHAQNFHDRETDKGYDRYHTTHQSVPHHSGQVDHLHKAMKANAKGDEAGLKKHMTAYHHGNENHKINKTATYPHAHHLPYHSSSNVNETFDPKHPKVMAARKAVKNGTYNGNVDRNGNAIVHIDGKPHTVTKGDPAARHESTSQLDELSPDLLKRYHKKAVKQYKQSYDKKVRGGYGVVKQTTADRHQKRFDKRHKGIGSEIKRTSDKDMWLRDVKGYVRDDPKRHSMTGKPAPYKYKLGEDLEYEEMNEAIIDIINENNITIEQLENMTEEELQELLGGVGKIIGGTARLGYHTARLAGRGLKKVGKAALMNKQGNVRGTQRAKTDAEKAQNDRHQSTLAKIQDKRRDNIHQKLAIRKSNRLKRDIDRAKAKLKQTQNKPKPKIY